MGIEAVPGGTTMNDDVTYRRLRQLSVALLFAITCSHGQAETMLTLDDAVRLALERNAQI